MRLMNLMMFLAMLTWLSAPLVRGAAPESAALPSIEELVGETERYSGFFDFYWDARQGKIWLEVDRFDDPFLYVNSLATGLGSNPVGLDRSQLGRDRLVHFERIGPKVLLVQPNLRYRAITENPDEKRAVDESFARSVLWGGKVAAQSGDRVLVDLTGFLLEDAHHVVGRLRGSNQGSYKIDLDRSAIYLPKTKAFPRNVEFEATLTFSSDSPGRLVSEVTPSPESVTVRQHHSFIQLPDDGYRPRRFDPRSGAIPTIFSDYATALDQPLEERLIIRHRLQKKDPSAAVSEAVEAIVYYLDRGAPEPVRSALLEGARWWNEAFEAAGYRDAFRVELLPQGADPLDVRYNVIQWVHRSTRGWSYGSSVVDPRTGEIIKGHVQLGSLRVRQDRMIVEGLHPLFNQNSHYGSCASGVAGEAELLAAFDPQIEPVEVALARIRQLSAHEVGHTLGFAHNFIASSYGRASVMDYPAPKVRITADGDLDLTEAYDTGIGEWDKISVRYAYGDFPAGADEPAELARILDEAISNRMFFVSDVDSRDPASPQPLSHLWDNGDDPIEELEHLLQVRRIALSNFGLGNIPDGRPLGELQGTLVPLYLFHRYQVEAVAKLLGGVHYYYKVKGDDHPMPRHVSADRQREALGLLIRTLQPEELVLPGDLLQQLHPSAYGYFDRRELFPTQTGRLFDPLAAAMNAADLTLSALLSRERAARLVTYHAFDPQLPGFDWVVDQLLEATWLAPTPPDPANAAVARVVERVVLERLMDLVSDERASSDVRAIAAHKLDGLQDGLGTSAPQGAVEAAHVAQARRDINQLLNRGYPPGERPQLPDPPPGSPIGVRSYE